MKNTLVTTLQKEGKEQKFAHYYVVECPHCHEKIAVLYQNVDIMLYKPEEVEVEYEELHFEDKPNGKLGKLMKRETKTRKEMHSTDYTKDLVNIELCPNCGHRNIQMLRTEFLKLPQVGFDGEEHIRLELSEKETQDAKEFMKEHKDCTQKHLGRRFFSASGGQFTYTITPTGLGECINIKCNACKQSKDITDSDSW